MYCHKVIVEAFSTRFVQEEINQTKSYLSKSRRRHTCQYVMSCSFSFFNFKLCVFSFYFILFFLSTFSWLLTKWCPPALCTCSCWPCFNELAVLMNLGHISHYFCPLCQGCDWRYYALPFEDFLWCIMYLHCWLFGFDFCTTLTINILSLSLSFICIWCDTYKIINYIYVRKQFAI